MELLHDCVLISVLAGEPLVESLGVTEDVRKEKVKKSPELVEIVLERCSSNKKSVTRGEKSDDL